MMLKPARPHGLPPLFRASKPPIMAIALALVASIAVPQEARAQATELSGKEVVAAVCSKCHATGAQGAPKIGDEQAWKKRASQGLSALTDHALKGIRQMPAHGGSGLSDFEIGARYLIVNQSAGNGRADQQEEPPAARSANKSSRRNATVPSTRVRGAPNRRPDAWIPRLKDERTRCAPR
jgi:cytochrome c5